MTRFDNVIGKYLYMELDGIEYRVYFEESGSGIPLILQHTAGSDGRQWRHLMEDESVTRHFRVIAPDLPYHGKSLPPLEVKWWETEYKLTQDFFMTFIVTLCEALAVDRPVFMGSSMGGHVAPDLALHYPDTFQAVIGLEAAHATPGGNLDWFYHPRISNDYKSHMMYGLTSPTSPEKYRRETIWCYSQGAPVVFKGDLNYYSNEHNLTGKAHDIDTSKVKVYLLTGEYDWASPPVLSELLAQDIEGAKFQAMKNLGHFPMCEDYSSFRKYILPVLEEIKKDYPSPRPL